jgi:O-Antigen ligase
MTSAAALAPTPFPCTGRGGAPAGRRAVRAMRLFEAIGYALLALSIFFICFTFLRPSPYDFIAVPAMALWIALGIRIHRATIPFMALLLVYHLGLLIALFPYFDEANPIEWTYQSAYLMCTAIFFAMFCAEDTPRRITFILKAYVASCVVAAVAGIISYFDLLGQGVLFKMDGRAAGVFEDPNVLGSFLVPGTVYLMSNLVRGLARSRLVTFGGLVLLLAGIFFSFSRGSWAATVVANVTMLVLMYRTSPSAPLRRRIVTLGVVSLLTVAIGIAGALSVDGIAERFEDRAQVTKDYDEGVTGRFGNQLRGMPMLLERPNGFGPLRWRLTFGLEPHNSYIGGFANGGWLGGFAFLALVLTTAFVGFRLCLSPSPVQRLAQIVWPALFIFFLQALQIDVDHWRHVSVLLGMLWGLEAARVAWARRSRRPESATRPMRTAPGRAKAA